MIMMVILVTLVILIYRSSCDRLVAISLSHIVNTVNLANHDDLDNLSNVQFQFLINN